MLVRDGTLTQQTGHQGNTVLIVEDDEDIGEVLSEIVRTETGLYPVVVSHASLALHMMEQMMPCLCLLDYQLPDMNGLDLSDRIRLREEFAYVPIVLISANLPPVGELKKRRASGLAKPFEMDDLVRVIRQALTTVVHSEISIRI